MIQLKLDFPPTGNHAVKMKYGRHFRTGKAQGYMEGVWLAAREQLGDFKPIENRIAMRVKFYPPDQRKRDLDNFCKVLQDALAYAGVYKNDEQIDILHLYRENIVEGGNCHVEIQTLNNEGMWE